MVDVVLPEMLELFLSRLFHQLAVKRVARDIIHVHVCCVRVIVHWVKLVRAVIVSY